MSQFHVYLPGLQVCFLVGAFSGHFQTSRRLVDSSTKTSSLQLHGAVVGPADLARGGNIDCIHNLVATTTLMVSPLSLNIHSGYGNIFPLFKYYVFEVASATKNLEILLIEKEFSKKLYLSEVIKMI